MKDEIQIVVIGGGAAGIFGAIAAAEAHPQARIVVLEKSGALLAKVRISGGGRCNVTHACFEPRALVKHYPRGSKALIGPFNRFQPRDTIAWFAARDVELKTEADGRMFPVTDDSQTILDALLGAAQEAGVELRTGAEVTGISRRPEGGFDLTLKAGAPLACARLLVASGGPKRGRLLDALQALGHTIEESVPSLFTFNLPEPWVGELAGISVPEVEASVAGTKLKARGPLLITHWGLSGPAILKLSAWGARELHARDYRFDVRLDWLPDLNPQAVFDALEERRRLHPAKCVVNVPIAPLPSRLWERFVAQAGIGPDVRWSGLPGKKQRALVERLKNATFAIEGKSTNKDEFVTCGGVRLKEIDFKTMESRLVAGLHFAGEALDIDGITGGFNFQAAWTTGWLAGRGAGAGER